MPAVVKRRRMSSIGSTSSIGIGVPFLQREALAQRDRRGFLHRGDILLVILPLARLVRALDADIGVEALQDGGVQAWSSPSRRKR
jgi:hypothetical protein